MTNQSQNKTTIFLGYAIIIIILFFCFELFSAFIIFKHPRTTKLFYSGIELNKESFQKYLKARDPVLGWPAITKIGTDEYDMKGARPDPSYPKHNKTCLSTYGDSFTYGEEVDNQAAWGHLLSQKINCRVANYGVPGYGTGQAYLRFKKNTKDEAPIVVLGIYQENILRVVNQYRYLITRGDNFSFKPRLIIQDNKLKTIPIPIENISKTTEISQSLSDIKDIFRNEWFVPGTTDGPAKAHFPYTLSVINALLTKRVQNAMLGKPNWIDFYSPEHSSGALPLINKIVDEFSTLAKKRNQKFKVIIFPSTAGYLYTSDYKKDPTATLLEHLRSNDYDYLDLTETISKELNGKDYCELLTNKNRHCSGHYNEIGRAHV